MHFIEGSGFFSFVFIYLIWLSFSSAVILINFEFHEAIPELWILYNCWKELEKKEINKNSAQKEKEREREKTETTNKFWMKEKKCDIWYENK